MTLLKILTPKTAKVTLVEFPDKIFIPLSWAYEEFHKLNECDNAYTYTEVINLIILCSKRKGNDCNDSDSTSSFDDNFSISKGRIKNLHKLGIKHYNWGFPEGIKEENEENTTKTKMSGKLNNFTGLHKKRTEVEKDKKDDQHLNPNLINKK